MDVGTRIQLPRRLNECIDELVVLLSTNALLLEPEIQVVIQKLFVVCSAIKNNSQCSVGMNASTEGCQDQLCD